jgi:hypothetical protein
MSVFLRSGMTKRIWVATGLGRRLRRYMRTAHPHSSEYSFDAHFESEQMLNSG